MENFYTGKPTDYFYNILAKVHDGGQRIKTRGLEVKELIDFRYTLPPRVRFMCFDHRKLKMDYVKQEFLWYLNGDRRDVSIKHLASMWDGLVNFDGSINSNYGYYLFNKKAGDFFAGRPRSNFERCMHTLSMDPGTRRAVLMILNTEHLNDPASKDYPCTVYLNFLIRDNKLHMLVRMRSQDAIYGMGNDAPFFSLVHELMYNSLKNYNPSFRDLQMGLYQHSADSFHVYERHYDMLDKIISDPSVLRDEHDVCPAMTGFTEHYLQSILGKVRKGHSGEVLVDEWKGDAFITWLMTRDDPTTIRAPENV